MTDVFSSNEALHNVPFTVIEGRGQSLLGQETAIKLNVLTLGSEINIVQHDIIRENPELFTGIGKLRNYQL